jgi:hypothetical protein
LKRHDDFVVLRKLAIKFRTVGDDDVINVLKSGGARKALSMIVREEAADTPTNNLAN